MAGNGKKQKDAYESPPLQQDDEKQGELVPMGGALVGGKWLWCNAFDEPGLERLYQSYSVKQRRAGLECYVFAIILHSMLTIIAPPGPYSKLVERLSAACSLKLAIVLLAAVAWLRDTAHGQNERKWLWAIMPHAAWHLANAQLASLLFAASDHVTPRDQLGWTLLLVYLTYVSLPLRLRYCNALAGCTCAAYLLTVAILTPTSQNHTTTHLSQQLVCDLLLLTTAIALGLTAYFVEDAQQRRAFLETRRSLEVKLVIEEQSAEQERLLLSVLPEHVAKKMRQDLGSADTRQFKKIYMSRHENVSILYADIVGFTAISSTYSAQELVKILNELFARFDKLSERYEQLRIKILGDCYYCISGAPTERPDHAVLCVHMGLSMVKAIKYVQQTTNSPVDMRVGIHTGAILAGVLGQRQWQFDIYSKDVELANKMESSGAAGRVHISETTFSYLNGEFEVEPAFGEKREEALRLAGLRTFFITRVLVPWRGKGAGANGTVEQEDTEMDNDTSAAMADDMCDNDTTADNVHSGDGDGDAEQREFESRLREELMSRDGHRELKKHTRSITLAFTSSDTEQAYHKNSDCFSSVTLQAFLVVRLAIGLAQFLVLPRRMMNLASFAAGNFLLMIISTISLADVLPAGVCPSPLINFFRWINESTFLRRTFATLTILLLATANVVDMASCSLPPEPVNCTEQVIMNDHLEEGPILYDLAQTGKSCLYPSYFSYFSVLVLVAASLPASLSYLAKTFLMCAIAGVHAAANAALLNGALTCERWRDSREMEHLSLPLLLIAVTLALTLLTRHQEQVARVLYLWRTEVETQRERASDMRRRNEALVYNVLPPHVAVHFMNRRRKHQDLYSHSYPEVGVLFASMPNFGDFYSEEQVNNQGLECLRFLNEVISDFDALLEQPQFKDIIKIKTIGSTYMAACGLSIDGVDQHSKVVDDNAAIEKRWAHLSLLVEFALELKHALQSINEQSFNHFVLKMGINHGPITAGVIGARKPHYDIWGNTVNVASRMESTGKAGCIQVTDETCRILEHFGYEFEQRGLVAVKGKGQLMTYYLLGKKSGGQTAQKPQPQCPPPSNDDR